VVSTNQRVLFDLDHASRVLVTPSLDHELLVYDLWAEVPRPPPPAGPLQNLSAMARARR
jgi:hypothetical protein